MFMNFFLKKYASNQKVTFNIFYLKFRLQYDNVFYYLILQNFRCIVHHIVSAILNFEKLIADS